MRGAVRHHTPAQAMPIFVGLIALLLVTLGLIQDGMLVFAAHRRASLLAESAARAGASQFDLPAARANPGQTPPLDPPAAETAARTYVLRQQPNAVVDARADRATIEVTVRLQVPPTFLHPPGQPTIDVMATGSAHPFSGLATAPP